AGMRQTLVCTRFQAGVEYIRVIQRDPRFDAFPLTQAVGGERRRSRMSSSSEPSVSPSAPIPKPAPPPPVPTAAQGADLNEQRRLLDISRRELQLYAQHLQRIRQQQIAHYDNLAWLRSQHSEIQDKHRREEERFTALRSALEKQREDLVQL